MNNDIWYLGQGYWAVYTDDSSVAEQLHNLAEVELVTVYRHIRKGGIVAMQYKFYGGDNLRRGCCKLSEVCATIGLDFNRVLSLALRREYLPYSQKYFPNGQQTQLSFNSAANPKNKTKNISVNNSLAYLKT